MCHTRPDHADRALQFVSVASQRDTERADVEKERKAQETAESREIELKELAAIYKGRGLQPSLAMEVARQLSDHDVVRAHARDECEPAFSMHIAFPPASCALQCCMPSRGWSCCYRGQRCAAMHCF